MKFYGWIHIIPSLGSMCCFACGLIIFMGCHVSANPRTKIDTRQSSVGLVAYYALDEGSGTVARDSSGNNNDGTHRNSPTYTSGRIGSSALDVTGINDHVEVPDDPALDFGSGDFSVSVWFNSSQIPSGQARIIGQSNSGNGWVIYTDGSGTLSWSVTGTTGSRTIGLSGLLDGAWHHVAGVRSGASMIFYIDGLPGLSSGGVPLGNVNNTEPLLIGTSSVSGDFNGLIDEIRLYNRALSASEVTELFNDAGNTEETLQTNAGLSILASQSAPITQSLLETADAEQSAAQLTYTVTATPVRGTLLRNGSPLGLNDTFTQDDINNNLIVYSQNGKTESTDSFGFTVDDGIGTATSAAFNITIDMTAHAPSGLQATVTGEGGLSLNTDGGNNAYLLAADGGNLVGKLESVTLEASFAISSPGTSITPLISYAVGTNDEELGLFITNAGMIGFTANSNGTPVQSTSAAYLRLFDGQRHHVAVSWDAADGSVAFYVDGHQVESFSGYQTNRAIDGGGQLVAGQDQDTVLGGFAVSDVFAGTLYGIRIFSDVRTPAEILANYNRTLLFDESGMLANWTFNDLSTSGIVTDTVSGNNLTVQHVPVGSGFTASSPTLTFELDENTADGTVVGMVTGTDTEREARITSLLAVESNLFYSAVIGKFYQFSNTSLHWLALRPAVLSTTLNGVNGQFPTVRSATENAFIRTSADTAGVTGIIWLGGTDQSTEGQWFWQSAGVDGELFWVGDSSGSKANGAYHNWSTGEPDNAGNADWLYMEAAGAWSDGQLATTGGLAIEWNADDVLDQTHALTYSLTDDAGGRFRIDADSGEISVDNGALLDYETNSSHTITVRVSDGGLTYDEMFTISLNDRPEGILTVDTTRDVSDGDTASIDALFDDRGTDGVISLREAIIATNNTVSGITEEVRFNIPVSDANYQAGSNSYLIQLTTPLPLLDGNVRLDAWTQPGFDGTPSIDLDGSALGASNIHGLTSDQSDLFIRGFCIRNFSGAGIFLEASSNHTIIGNYIGTNIDGSAAESNEIGILLGSGADAVIIGGMGPNEGNLIAFNKDAGVRVNNVSLVEILGNRIHSNDGLGIDLTGGIENSFGVTANDAGDPDTGSNALQNYPVLTSAHTTGTRIAISGSLNSLASQTFRLAFFANTTADSSGHGEGERYLGSRQVTTAATGTATFTFMLSAAVAAGESISATAARLTTNETSEFALNTVAVTGLDSDSDGVLDIAEDRNLDGDNNPATGAPLDTDGDNTLDYLDPDDDGDGIATADEDANGNGDPTDDDTDGDGIPDYLDPDNGGPGDSDKDGVADDVECPSGPPCTDTDGDGIPNYNDPEHNTMVKRLKLEVIADATGVQLQWQTGFEVDNIGFHIERYGPGGPVQVTPSPIGGTALLAGPGTRLTAGHNYTWHDPAGTGQDRYSVVSIDLNGRMTRYGPVSARPVLSPFPALTPYPGAVPLSPLLTHFGKHPSPTRATTRAHRQARSIGPSVTTPVQPRAWERDDLAPREIQWAIAAGPALKINVQASGWYEIDQSSLVQAGLDVSVDPQSLQLFAEGEEQPILVEGEADGAFDPGDTLAFYSAQRDTPWSNTQAYWLVTGTQPGLRIQPVESTISPPGPRSFPFTVEHKKRQLYVAAVRNGEAENFFGAVLSTEPAEQILSLDHLDPEPPGMAKLRVALQGVTSGTHQVDVAVNSHPVHTLTFTGAIPQAVTIELSQNHLREGVNIVTLKPQGHENAVSLVDTIRLTYWRTYTARDGTLHSTAPGQHQITITGFQQPNIRVFDITSLAAIDELLGHIERDGGRYRITVTTPPGAERRLLAVAKPRHLTPDAMQANVLSSWHASERGANLLMISHPAFIHALLPLKHLREQQGWTVALIDAEALYNEFHYGVKHPEAIRAFLRHALEYWRQPPRFVLLTGDASLDPRGYLGDSMIDFLPTHWVGTTLMETASDAAFADPDRDGMAELYVGRLPAQTPEEATIMVNKLQAFATASGDWLHRALVITDRAGTFDFDGAANPMKQRLQQTLDVTTIALDDLTPAAAKQSLYQQLESGQLLVTYQGHGSVQRWASDSLLTSLSARTLTNTHQLPLVLSMTCLNGYFHDPRTESLAEALLRAPNGGAVAVWASSGLTRPSSQAEMQRLLIQHLLRPERPTLGEAIEAAKSAITDFDVRWTWLLFGDPTLRLP